MPGRRAGSGPAGEHEDDQARAAGEPAGDQYPDDEYPGDDHPDDQFPGDEYPDDQTGRAAVQPARYIGVDGPRWLLRGTISGQAAGRPELAPPLDEVFADVVVVRGDHPAPPRDLLEIQLPAEMRQAIEEEMAQADER